MQNLLAAILLATAAAFAYMVINVRGAEEVEFSLNTAASGSPERSFVIAVDHQAAGGQPYPRGCNSKQMKVAVGSGSSAVTYVFTVDTGSAIPMMTCQTNQSSQNCGGNLPASSNYVLGAAHKLQGAAACNATGVGCTLSDNSCFVSEALTGGQTFNINNGVFASDMLSFPTTANNAALAFKAIFGCALAYIQCSQDSTSTSCYKNATECPTTPGAANYGQNSSSLLKGACPGSNRGLELGWTFNDGTTASKIAVPQQVYDAGLISKRVTGLCYQVPQKDSNCSAPLKSNSMVVLGQQLPTGLTKANLSSAPLIPAVFPFPYPNPLAATPFTHTFRSLVMQAAVPVWRPASGQSWSSPFSGVSVLWDSGAYGQSTVPPNVFTAFNQYYQQGYASAVAAAKSRGFSIVPCSNAATMCGANVPTGPHVCQQILLRGRPPSSANLAFARRVLKSMYPAHINITLQGGGVAQLPTAFPVNICTGGSTTVTSGVAVCSYVQPTPSGSPWYFWLAGPWFFNRFVQFDASAPAAGFPTSLGTIYWSHTLSQCSF